MLSALPVLELTAVCAASSCCVPPLCARHRGAGAVLGAVLTEAGAPHGSESVEVVFHINGATCRAPPGAPEESREHVTALHPPGRLAVSCVLTQHTAQRFCLR